MLTILYLQILGLSWARVVRHTQLIHSFVQHVVLRACSVEAGSPGSEVQNGWGAKQKALVIKKFIVEAGNKTSKCNTVS